MDFFGQIVYVKIIEVDPKKIDMIKICPRHLFPSDIRSFFGLLDYYRMFVERFSSIAFPLIASTQNKDKLIFSKA